MCFEGICWHQSESRSRQCWQWHPQVRWALPELGQEHLGDKWPCCHQPLLAAHVALSSWWIVSRCFLLPFVAMRVFLMANSEAFLEIKLLVISYLLYTHLMSAVHRNNTFWTQNKSLNGPFCTVLSTWIGDPNFNFLLIFVGISQCFFPMLNSCNSLKILRDLIFTDESFLGLVTVSKEYEDRRSILRVTYICGHSWEFPKTEISHSQIRKVNIC